MGLVDANRDVKKYAIIGVPSQASVLNKKIITEMAKGFFDGVMVASEPFCVAYNLGELEHTLVIDIGAGTTDICRVHGTLPEPDDQVSSNKAGDYIDAELVKLISEEYTNVRVTNEVAKNGRNRVHSWVSLKKKLLLMYLLILLYLNYQLQKRLEWRVHPLFLI